MPRTAPTIVVRPTSARALRDLGLAAVAVVAAVVVVTLVGSSAGRLPWPSVAALLGVAAVGCLVLAVLGRRVRRSLVAELQCGYVTAQFTMGGFWLRRPPDGGWNQGRIPWDWTATWVLRSDGTTIRSTPAGDTDPPGLYPSPRDPTCLELWTGCRWTNYTVPYPEDGAGAQTTTQAGS